MKMPLDGIFIEPSSTSLPDLSLHISPPNPSSSSQICNTSNEVDTRRTTESQAHTELSLGMNFTTPNPYQQQRHLVHHHHHPNNRLNHMNHGVLDVSSDGLKPIKGIPVYQHHRSFPFLPMDQVHTTRDKEAKMCYYQMPSNNPSLCTSSSSVSHAHSSPYGGGLDAMSILSSGPNASSLAAAYNRLGTAAVTRFNGLSTDAFKSHQLHHHHHHNQYGVGPSEVPHGVGMMRSRFMPKLPTKRSMRAPRMRWTSTLHARFVHAVELLGGHESKDFIFSNIDICSLTFSIFFYFSCLNLDFFFFFFFYVCFPFCLKSIWGMSFRSYTKISSWAHGCEGSHISACKKPFTGKYHKTSLSLSLSLSFSVSLFV